MIEIYRNVITIRIQAVISLDSSEASVFDRVPESPVGGGTSFGGSMDIPWINGDPMGSAP